MPKKVSKMATNSKIKKAGQLKGADGGISNRINRKGDWRISPTSSVLVPKPLLASENHDTIDYMCIDYMCIDYTKKYILYWSTITLYASQINQMPSLVTSMSSCISNLQTDLFGIKNKALKVSQDVCDLEQVITSVQTSTQIQEDEIASLETYKENHNDFVSEVVRIDTDVADLVNQNKEDFYNQYSYLKPYEEMSRWEKFCDNCQTAGEWCRENWKLVSTIVIVGLAIVVIVMFPTFSPILLAVAKGALIGAAWGGTGGAIIGGITNVMVGEGFLEGAISGGIEGALSGALSGTLTGGITSALHGTEGIKNGVTIATRYKNGLSKAKTAWIAAGSDATVSLISDMGDIYIKKEHISLFEVVSNSAISLITTGGTTFIGGLLNNKISLKIRGINEGRGSWMATWRTQFTRAFSEGRNISAKTILKGMGAEFIEDMNFNYSGLIKDFSGEVIDKKYN